MPVKKTDKKKDTLLTRLPRPGRRGWIRIMVALCVLALLPIVYSYVARKRAYLLRIDQVAIQYLGPKGYKLAYRDATCLGYLNRMQAADLAEAPDRVAAAFEQGVKEGCFVRRPGAPDRQSASDDQALSSTVALSEETELKHLRALRARLVDSDDCAYYKKRSDDINQDAGKDRPARIKALKRLFETARTFRCLK